jgi:hypothetical protein
LSGLIERVLSIVIVGEDPNEGRFRGGTFKSIADLAKDIETDPENLGKREKYFSKLGELYKKILSVLPEKEKKKEFFIIKGIRDFPSLVEHEPGPFYYHHLFGVWGPFESPPLKVQSDEEWEKIKRESEELASRMKQWFREAGCSRVSLYSSVAELSSKSIEKIKNNQAYVIFDRHVIGNLDSSYRDKDDPARFARFVKVKEFWGDYLSDAQFITEKKSFEGASFKFF